MFNRDDLVFSDQVYMQNNNWLQILLLEVKRDLKTSWKRKFEIIVISRVEKSV